MALLSPPSPPPPLPPLRRRPASPTLLAVATRPSSLLSLPHCHCGLPLPSTANARAYSRSSRRRRLVAASLGQDEPGVSDTAVAPEGEGDSEPPASSDGAAGDIAASAEQPEASPEDLEDIRQVKRVLELLQKNRDMTFGEVKLTIMIEDPRDIERKRLLGIEDPDEITRDDLADALVEVNEGRIPENRVALQLLAKEMTEWPDLEMEAPKKKSKPGKSVYAKATDTGIDPETAAKRLNIDWDSAADLDDEEEEDDETEVPSAVGYSALYLLTAFPVIIGISVVLILFYNSLQ
uniref:Protein CHLOROPLAST ENHANCING STRESS TOLERANCE, chloroplastic n=1 Tax=Oryza glumipatula TaxID=40148 RepID=A0A0D9YG53_9ORYZ